MEEPNRPEGVGCSESGKYCSNDCKLETWKGVPSSAIPTGGEKIEWSSRGDIVKLELFRLHNEYIDELIPQKRYTGPTCKKIDIPCKSKEEIEKAEANKLVAGIRLGVKACKVALQRFLEE